MTDVQVPSPRSSSPKITGVLAVVAHPDDESFALGAVLDRLTDDGARSTVLCFTSGEASTLHSGVGELSAIRAVELRDAATALRLGRVELLHYPDGALAGVSIEELTQHVLRLVADERPSHLLVFDRGGVTGHPDHDRATQAALAAARAVGLPVLAWALPEQIARQLNTELGTAFVGRPAEELDLTWVVSRRRQRRAIDCHHSQSTDNPVLRRRLQLLGDIEYLRLLYPPHRPERPVPAPATHATAGQSRSRLEQS
jgi:LmbE family N-acetylglucosaminyl deacetylase